MTPPEKRGTSKRGDHVNGVTSRHSRHWQHGYFGKAFAVRVVGPDDGALGVLAREECGLRLKVLLHRAVIVQVVVTEIREGGHAESKSVHSMLVQGVTRHLEGDE